MAAAMTTMPVMSLRPVGVQRTAAARPSRVAVQTRRIIAVRASPVRLLPARCGSRLVEGKGFVRASLQLQQQPTADGEHGL